MSPIEVNHQPECLEYNNRRLLAILEFAEEWPNYCRMCGATGEVCYSFDPSPAGVALSPGSMQDCDPCEGKENRPCAEQGFCPRCASNIADPYAEDEEHTYCQTCGWEWHKTDSAPPAPECVCPQGPDVMMDF